MQGLLLVDKGLEDTAILELKELVKAKGKTVEPSLVLFNCKEEDLARLCYKGQSMQRVLLLLGSAACKPDLESIEKTARKIAESVDWKSWLKKGKSFCCEAAHLIDTDFKSMDLERTIGGEVFEVLEKVKCSPKVSLKDPDLFIYAILTDKTLYLGVDFAGRDVSKRSYKLYHHATSLKGTIAYSAVRFSSFKPSETLIDPFCGSGVIPIEAALFASKFPVNHFTKNFAFEKQKDWSKSFIKWDKEAQDTEPLVFGSDHLLMNLKSSQNNAKIAGVEKWVKCSKAELEWLDTHFKKASVDHIVTHPPEPSQHQNEKIIAKLYKEFFYQADFVLKKTGKITVLIGNTSLFLEIAKERNFALEKEAEVWSGKRKYKLVQLEKAC